MSIILYTGIPGSSKSLHAAQRIRLNLGAGVIRPTLANFPLADGAPVKRPELYTYMPNEEMTAGRLMAWADTYWSQGHRFRESALQVILDECQIIFNSRRWSAKDRMDYLSLLSQSRKHGLDFILIAQHAKMIDNQFRMLVETECNHRRMSTFGLFGALVSAPFRGRLFLWQYKLFQINERMGSEWYVANRKDMAMYDSYATFTGKD